MIPQSRHNKSPAPSASRNRQCLGDPACVWPPAGGGGGLCVHHLRFHNEAALWEDEPEPAPQEQRAAARAKHLAMFRRSLTAQRAPVRPDRRCQNPRCANPIGANNRSGLCTRCGDAFRAFNLRRPLSRRISVQQYLRWRARLGLDPQPGANPAAEFEQPAAGRRLLH